MVLLIYPKGQAKNRKGVNLLNKNILESQMKLHGDTGGRLAEYLGVSGTTFSHKLNGKNTEFTQSEIAKIVARYNLSAEVIVSIFFKE